MGLENLKSIFNEGAGTNNSQISGRLSDGGEISPFANHPDEFSKLDFDEFSIFLSLITGRSCALYSSTRLLILFNVVKSIKNYSVYFQFYFVYMNYIFDFQ